MKKRGFLIILVVGLMSGCTKEKPKYVGEYDCGEILKLSIGEEESTIMIGKEKHTAQLDRMDDNTSSVDFKELGKLFYDTSKEGTVHIQKKKQGEIIYTCTLIEKK